MVKELDVNVLTDADFGRQLLRRVRENGDQYILKENDQAEAALLSIDDLELLKRVKVDKEKARNALFKVMDAIHERNAQFSAEEVEADVDAAIREIRQGQ